MDRQVRMFLSLFMLMIFLSTDFVAARESLRNKVHPDKVNAVVSTWKAHPGLLVVEMTEKYGMPDEVYDDHMVWLGNGFWKRTIIYNRDVPHHGSGLSPSILENVIVCNISQEDFEGLGQFRNAFYFNQEKREISARFNCEEENTLAFNLAHEILLKKRTPVEAHRCFMDHVQRLTEESKTQLCERLIFHSTGFGVRKSEFGGQKSDF